MCAHRASGSRNAVGSTSWNRPGPDPARMIGDQRERLVPQLQPPLGQRPDEHGVRPRPVAGAERDRSRQDHDEDQRDAPTIDPRARREHRPKAISATATTTRPAAAAADTVAATTANHTATAIPTTRSGHRRTAAATISAAMVACT